MSVDQDEATGDPSTQEAIMADQPKPGDKNDPGYNAQINKDFVEQAQRVDAHKGENKTTTSTEGSVEKTTRTEKS
jgi:hypothetical protein